MAYGPHNGYLLSEYGEVGPAGFLFSWEPALWPLDSCHMLMVSKKNHCHLKAYNQWVLRLDMKTKVVKNVNKNETSDSHDSRDSFKHSNVQTFFVSPPRTTLMLYELVLIFAPSPYWKLCIMRQLLLSQTLPCCNSRNVYLPTMESLMIVFLVWAVLKSTLKME